MADETPTSLIQGNERPVIGGKYVLDKLIGDGGYSWVYLANHKQIQDLRYVVKLLKPSHLGNDQVLRRFEQEATTLARLRSPRIVKIVDYGPTEAGIPYIVSEYVDGVTLGLVLRQHGKLSPWLTAHLGCQVLEAMRDAHAGGVVHRDIKPDNILVTAEQEGEPPAAMVLDFGIAKVTEDAASDADSTVEGLACSPRYAAPEVLMREPSARSDIYALGLVLAELMTGRPVFRGSHNLILASEQLSQEKVPIAESVLSTPLGPIIRKACEKQQAKRFDTADEMLEHLIAARDAFATDAAQKAVNELSLVALMESRDERPLSEAEQTALNANLHTYEQQFTGTGNLPSNIDQIVAAQQSSKLMRALIPIIAVVLVATLGVLGWVIFRVQQGPDPQPDTVPVAQPTVTEEPTTEPPRPEIAFAQAERAIGQALSQAGFNQISVTSSVAGAALYYGDALIGNLPVQNLVTNNTRPLTLTVKAAGFEDADLSVVQTGRVRLDAALQEEGSREEATVQTTRTPTPSYVQPRTPTPTPAPTPTPTTDPRRLGDYIDNPFGQ